MDMDNEPDTAQLKQRVSTNSLYQQKLAAWRPLMTPSCISWIFVVVAVLFIILGSLILDASVKTIEINKRYDDQCQLGMTCILNIEIEHDMEAPIYFYYKLVNFYQNHRSYVMDFAIDQLQGDIKDTTGCSVKETQKDGDDPTYPCGLIANSIFNDVFTASLNNQTLEGQNWDGSNIAWTSDRDTKFKNVSNDNIDDLDDVNRIGTRGNLLPFPSEQDFMVWFRVAGLPRFNKLYRKISDKSFKKGDTLTVFIDNLFDVSEFRGEKHIFISEVSWIGGSNFFLGICYLVVGLLCAIYAILMLLKRSLDHRRMGEMKYYSWTGLGATAEG
mmetsp:Transcript_18904/g.26322  ORF Transcript_18904/g.26322 Transcript_18904/m.26322 type:complete len:329 (+) Transcript_18904:110-1096(+)|eukprot:CAMPEP_0184488490 /NCGR_PEP_ID=MMETSP0113_2-20130426/12247_1 /TAXON_ID=91329 /ORGANISM="Norrisiella sphaerica, Strain BC52" /LENGTH=328 /DNA_ID=CAMNT_0026871321 /DNA_START=30 /DNA_END=1016 /DNA_ORIENTATION=-